MYDIIIHMSIKMNIKKEEKEKILTSYQNKWVILTKDRKKVTNSDKTIRGIIKKASGLKKDQAVITKVLPFGITYSP